MSKHVKWAEIQNFHNLRKLVKTYPELLVGKSEVTYKAKVKLHGTNAGVRVSSDGSVHALSRTSVITPQNDNAGFAGWVYLNSDSFASLSNPSHDVVVYGEWCGPGIQQGVACTKLSQKVFAVFAIRLLDVNDDVKNQFIVEPEEIKAILSGCKLIGTMHVLPWYSVNEKDCEFTLDLLDMNEKTVIGVDEINQHVLEIEKCDPWVKAEFGVEGIGEGLVLYPVDVEHGGYTNFVNLSFKAKGEKHQTVSKTKPVQSSATVEDNVVEFVKMVCPLARLEQGLMTVNGNLDTPDMKNMGPFIKWIVQDVLKECQAEIAASGIDLKVIMKNVEKLARTWFMICGDLALRR